jgi:ribonuclease HII
LLKSHFLSDLHEAGCDEAGRGCLAGPVFAAAVILPDHYQNPVLNDSKKLSACRRILLRPVIEHDALAWSVAWVDNEKIDEVNILRASIMAMHMALDKLGIIPEHILVDGNCFFPYRNIRHRCIVRGDGLYASIAAASVLAKTWRDEYMIGLHNDFPSYRWDRNKGYPTQEHRRAIHKFGISPYHRKSFSLFDEQLELFF